MKKIINLCFCILACLHVWGLIMIGRMYGSETASITTFSFSCLSFFVWCCVSCMVKHMTYYQSRILLGISLCNLGGLLPWVVMILPGLHGMVALANYIAYIATPAVSIILLWTPRFLEDCRIFCLFLLIPVSVVGIIQCSKIRKNSPED